MKSPVSELRPIPVVFICLMCLGVLHMSAQERYKPAFSFSLFGETSRFAIGDLNKAIDSYNHNSYFEYLRSSQPDLISGSLDPLPHASTNLGMELRCHLSGRIALGVTLMAPYHLSNYSTITYAVVGGAGAQITSRSDRNTIKAGFSLLLTAHYSLIRNAIFGLSVHAGVAYRPAHHKLTREYDIQYPLGGRSLANWSWDLSRSFPIGFHSGLGFSARLSRKLALIVEATVRVMDIGHLTGRYRGTSSSFDPEGNLDFTNSYYGSGTLYYFSIFDDLIGTRYETVSVYESRPSEGGIDWISDVRNANLNLNGYSIRLGVMVNLF